jgi:hypothetical protein
MFARLQQVRYCSQFRLIDAIDSLHQTALQQTMGTPFARVLSISPIRSIIRSFQDEKKQRKCHESGPLRGFRWMKFSWKRPLHAARAGATL